MKRLRSELSELVNRSVDRHVRLAVTGFSVVVKRHLLPRWLISYYMRTVGRVCHCFPPQEMAVY
uniref:Uncharacterized protein n=1 Tax=Arsenophonus endosymbiont of Trialeurodes vaporariorum TaxID=235567 RepID=A0A3B0MFA7_9GAMM